MDEAKQLRKIINHMMSVCTSMQEMIAEVKREIDEIIPETSEEPKRKRVNKKAERIAKYEVMYSGNDESFF